MRAVIIKQLATFLPFKCDLYPLGIMKLLLGYVVSVILFLYVISSPNTAELYHAILALVFSLRMAHVMSISHAENAMHKFLRLI